MDRTEITPDRSLALLVGRKGPQREALTVDLLTKDVYGTLPNLGPDTKVHLSVRPAHWQPPVKGN